MGKSRSRGASHLVISLSLSLPSVSPTRGLAAPTSSHHIPPLRRTSSRAHSPGAAIWGAIILLECPLVLPSRLCHLQPRSRPLRATTTANMVTIKEPVVRMRLCGLAACILLVARCATAQSIVATNSTTPSPPGTKDTPMTISRNDDMVPLAPVLPLTAAAMDEIPVWRYCEHSLYE